MSTFKFGPNNIRVVNLNGEPWFVAVDVCCVMFDAVYIRQKGPSNYTAKLDSDEKQTLSAKELASLHLVGGSLGNRRASLISESGLYKLVMRSDKPEAKAFQDWVTREVLPAY